MTGLLGPIGGLPGVGTTLARLLAEACGGPRIFDLLLHLPERVVVRQLVATPAEAPLDADCVLEAVALGHRAARSGRSLRPYVEVRAEAGGRPITLRFMNGRLPWILKLLPPGEPRFLAGRVQTEGSGGFGMMNPQVAAQAGELPLVEPVWPMVRGLTGRRIAAAMDQALALLPDPPEWADASLVAQEAWPAFATAIRTLQRPAGPLPALPRRRLAYDELLAHQVAIALVRRRQRDRPGRAMPGTGALAAKALAAFGHEPTPGQAQALAEIAADMAAPRRMLRLVQGDVGSGKTLVAVLAMLQAVESGAQAALMAPTELLARQHLRTLEKLCVPAGVQVELLTGSVKGAARKRVLRGLADGMVQVVVGTHALFQEAVVFRNLGLSVVDEQHRFGTGQRLMLARKGQDADMLVMTATPIPRTLLLTQWGEMAVSRLEGKPAGRQPIATRIVGQDRLPDVIDRLGDAMARGERAYWVVRAISGGEHDDSVAAEDRFAELAARFPGKVGMAHGMQDLAVREAALADFAAGTTQLLVATTVIEVGVDVPDATIMLIEQAERFGLAALHQLRGRVGRGSRPSSCLLVHSTALGEAEKRRLLVLRDTEDGFRIAEEDLFTRGGGDALGARQSGLPGARLLDPREEAEEVARLTHLAHQDAALLLHRDPSLASPRGRAALGLLALFGHDTSLATLDAG
ncbi:ATP-dependent DNA helicase RecG [Falsiroseomonas selenitidurans]|uniref:ATP-dependent DNA helicase RecG n=1 Tax=Falsiroseomonas selenitidurans TaxID=2716335 RepID=UPI002E2C4A12|nr:ATP-dependent DNA helicase RecG [Falsiroseomonas selenitidurans]